MALRICAVLLGAVASVSAQAVNVSVVSNFRTAAKVSATPVPLSNFTLPINTNSTASSTASAAVSTSTMGGDMHDGCIHFQVVHSTNTAHFGKRAVELSLANRSDVAYYAKLSFGTPAQAQYVQLDTGSFELWVNPTCKTGLSLSDASFCEAVGNFDTSASSTFTSLKQAKQLRYGIGSANITYVTDDISLPGTTSVLRQVQFGVATSTTDEFSGILGIGYGLGLTTTYPNFVDELALQNITKVKAFSLALGSKDEQEGVIVFGGVDQSKFAGKLQRLPITPAEFSPDGVPRYWVNMTGMTLTPPAGSASTATKMYADSAMQVFIDSGSTLTLLPETLANSIAADFDAVGPDSNGFYTVDCSLAAASTGSLNFAFGDMVIRVPYRELIRQSGSTCMLGVQASTAFVLLGDTFMRSAYVVIDQTDNVVWLAPYVNCGSTPAALASASSLPKLTGKCSLDTNSLDVSSSSSSSASASASSTATKATSKTASSTKASATTTTSSASTSTSFKTSTTSAARVQATPEVLLTAPPPQTTVLETAAAAAAASTELAAAASASVSAAASASGASNGTATTVTSASTSIVAQAAVRGQAVAVALVAAALVGSCLLDWL
ncbi:MAG: hypothetical protein STHCBS139747_001080 [Sporothrix thermara]